MLFEILLLLIGDREPIFDQHDARADQYPLELRPGAEEFLDIVLRAETHDPLDASPVVPAAVEQDDFSAGGQMRHISLEIPLRAFALARRREDNQVLKPGRLKLLVLGLQ